MTPLEEFDQWMENKGNNFINDTGILFNKTPEFVFMDSPWPGYDSVDVISIILFCTSGKELFDTLSIEAAHELEKVQPEHMLNLFYAGQAMVICTTPNGESLQFEKGTTAMIAIIDGADLGHQVKEQLVMPDDFIRYTNQCFRVLKAQSKNKSKGS